jgi:hypothetical protein
VQRVIKALDFLHPGGDFEFLLSPNNSCYKQLITKELVKNDGFDSLYEFTDWFIDYPDGEMAIVHFTDFQYGEDYL